MIFFNYLLNDFLSLSFWLLIGCTISTLLHFFVPNNLVNKHLSSNNLASVLKASLIGVPLPLCSCSVVPTVIGLKNKGVNNASNMSFLISTPQTGVDSILITAAFFGWGFAFYKLGIALLLGLSAGLVYIFFAKRRQAVTNVGDGQEELEGFTLKNFYSYFINESLYMIWKWLLIGLILASLIQCFIPPDFMSTINWANGFVGVILVLAFSLVTYICATGSVPLAAALVHTGFPSEAALVLLIAGPATNISTLTIVLKHFGKGFIAIYLSVVIIGSLAFAYALSGQFTVLESLQAHECMDRPWHEWISAIFLIGYMCVFAFGELKDFLVKKSHGAQKVDTLEVTGVTCQGCVRKINEALSKLSETCSAEMDFDSSELSIFSDGSLALDEIKALITELGFTVVERKKQCGSKKACCH